MNTRSSVLYVNDNPKSLRLLASILQDCGFEVKTAGAPWEAIELIHANPFALALLDYQMPEMSGAQLAREIRGLDASLPIILISGLSFLPASELVYVDAHVGHGSTIEDLTHRMRVLMEKDRAVVGPFGTAPHKSVPVAPGSR